MRFLMIIPHSTKKNGLPTYDKLLVKGCLQVRQLSLCASSIWGGLRIGVQRLGGGLLLGFAVRTASPIASVSALVQLVEEVYSIGVVQWLSVRLETVHKFKAGGDSWAGIGWLPMASRTALMEGLRGHSLQLP